MSNPSKILIGTSGFSYKHWRGVFYPDDVPQSKWLEYYAGHFETVELNSTFYHLPKDTSVENWEKRTPDNFIFSVKGSRFITHIKKFSDIEKPLSNFFEVISLLKTKLGPVLFQLPPSMKKDLILLEDFVSKLPENLRFAVEFRNAAWYSDDVPDILGKHNIAFCIHDMPGLASPLSVTGKFVYIRFHGAENAYSSFYSDEALRIWADRINGFSGKGYDVYAYFNNDYSGFAVKNAEMLKNILFPTRTADKQP